MSVWQTILVFVGAPGAVILFFWILTVGVARRRATVSYRPGDAWDHEDRLWAGAAPVRSLPVEDRVGTKLGGASANW